MKFPPMITAAEAKASAEMLRQDGLPDKFNRMLAVTSSSAKETPMPNLTSLAAAISAKEEAAKTPATVPSKPAHPSKPVPSPKAPAPVKAAPAAPLAKPKPARPPAKPNPALKPGKAAHPADEAAWAGIKDGASFCAQLFKDGTFNKYPFKTLAEARAKAAELNKASPGGRRAGVYALTSDGKAHLVPDSYQPGQPAPAAGKPAGAAKPAPAPKPKAPAKTAPKAAPAKPKAKDGAPSKTDIAVKLLTRPKGATRDEIVEATDWPSINLKPIAKRKGFKLVIQKDGVLKFVA